MSYISSKIVPTVSQLFFNGNFDLALRYCPATYITSRKYSIYNNGNHFKTRFIEKNYLTGNHFYSPNIYNKPNFKAQQRHFTDHFNGRTFFKWLSETTPVEYTQNFITSVHDISGLPWWATIIGTTIVLRSVITLPLAVYQTFILAKVENLALIDLPEVAKEVKREVAVLAMKNKWDDRRAQYVYKRMVKRKWDALVIQENCHPFKGTLTMWFQLPMWIFLTTALRNIAYMLPHQDATAQVQFLQMSLGGFLWIPNLTIPDETWIIPALLGITNLAIIELQTLRRIRQAPKFQKYITNFFRCLTVVLIPIAATVPSAVCLYWTTSSVIGLGQNLFLMSNRVRNVFHIPDTPTTLDNPYLQLLTDIKEKGKNIRSLFKK